ncbi:MAG: hypothetical protein ACYDCO_19615 [Armatimonadota bacterium]
MAKIRRFASLFMLCLALAAPGWCAQKYSVSAYCHRSRTAMGTKPRAGVCAGPRHLLGRYVRIAGWRYRVEDVCRRGFDIWLPSSSACKKFGRKQLTVQIGGRFRKK